MYVNGQAPLRISHNHEKEKPHGFLLKHPRADVEWAVGR